MEVGIKTKFSQDVYIFSLFWWFIYSLILKERRGYIAFLSSLHKINATPKALKVKTRIQASEAKNFMTV